MLTSLAVTTLSRVDNERFQRGVEGLTAGAYEITLTRFTDDEVSAYVSNGDGKSYSVTLTAVRSFCGCNDALFRGKTCKHSVALALYLIREPVASTPACDDVAQEPSPEETTPIRAPKLAKVRPTFLFSA